MNYLKLRKGTIFNFCEKSIFKPLNLLLVQDFGISVCLHPSSTIDPIENIPKELQRNHKSTRKKTKKPQLVRMFDDFLKDEKQMGNSSQQGCLILCNIVEDISTGHMTGYGSIENL